MGTIKRRQKLHLGKDAMSSGNTGIQQFLGRGGVGVDHADQLRTEYGLDRKSKKWWHRIFRGLLDIIFVNAYVVYCYIFQQLPLLQFRRATTTGLIAYKTKASPSGVQGQKRRATDNSTSSGKRRGKHFFVCRGCQERQPRHPLAEICGETGTV
ncbi:hypothetical protein PR048_017957 [Dryococelus australis]|uniref:PiggyBac transposable element-derived protein domain-containing protein n=1 Tax=Dryococelus australis TaxID=614101 RepID=A0ABQ9HAY4_9NEOP|nr:hypothetical protein PR048_017957 [Dryococelus australis]